MNKPASELIALADERAVLMAKNAAATSWGAAVGARSERIQEIDRLLAANQPGSERAGVDALRDDPSSDERWQAGLDFAMIQLCGVMGVDPHDVHWDAATEEVEGDVRAVMGNILRAKMGEDWTPPAQPAPAVTHDLAPHPMFETEEEADEAADNGRNTGGKSYYRPTENKIAAVETSPGDVWRCFHCDEVFTDKDAARDHFGYDMMAEPGCKLSAIEGGLLGIVRRQEERLGEYHREDTASYREFYSLGADHYRALRREEEKGYARGIEDCKKDCCKAAIDRLDVKAAAKSQERG